jgi:hypothetical protein
MNFRNGYKFDPEDSNDQSTGDLLGLLQAAIQQGRAQPPASFTPVSNGYGGSQSDWLTSVAALPPDQSSRQDGQEPIQQQDPNFRQLARVPAVRSAIDSSDGAGDQVRSGSAGLYSEKPSNSSSAQQLAASHAACVEKCLHLLPGDLQSTQYRKCYRECMERL